MTEKFKTLRNNESCPEGEIPVVDVDSWRKAIVDACKKHDGRIVSIFGTRKDGGFVRLWAVVGIDSRGELKVSATDIKGSHYPCLTNELTEAHLFERELHEELGIIPEGHPWLKPVRKREGYDFYSMAGESIHEVAVGPVHAGVIEPGHFRFQCMGEQVFNLEIHLGYQRRGIEDLITKSVATKRMILAESIAGDSTIAHGMAYCYAIEGLADMQVSQRARIIRGIALELERIANHVGDLGAISNDVGFLPAASYFGALKASFSNMLMLISGNRYGRSLLRTGGVRFDIGNDMAEELKIKISHGRDLVDRTIELMFSTPSVVSRLEGTGIVTIEMARKAGLVGMPARACNLSRDVRIDYPFGTYKFRKLIIAKAASGDVFARARVRALEIRRSIELIEEMLHKMPVEIVFAPSTTLSASSFVVSMVEGWRGEVAHIVRTDEAGDIVQYKIVDPSFHNWTGLELALRGGQISDFPLCNKSFNLSYAGYDL